jgi:hypothetical protein
MKYQKSQFGERFYRKQIVFLTYPQYTHPLYPRGAHPVLEKEKNSSHSIGHQQGQCPHSTRLGDLYACLHRLAHVHFRSTTLASSIVVGMPRTSSLPRPSAFASSATRKSNVFSRSSIASPDGSAAVGEVTSADLSSPTPPHLNFSHGDCVWGHD